MVTCWASRSLEPETSSPHTSLRRPSDTRSWLRHAVWPVPSPGGLDRADDCARHCRSRRWLRDGTDNGFGGAALGLGVRPNRAAGQGDVPRVTTATRTWRCGAVVTGKAAGNLDGLGSGRGQSLVVALRSASALFLPRN